MAEGGAFFEDGISENLEEGFIVGDALDAMQAGADDALAYAQDNAPWADRTGMARSSLYVEVYEEGDELVLDLAHTVDYGIWLETIQNGRFAIIMPTLEIFADQIFEAAGARGLGYE